MVEVCAVFCHCILWLDALNLNLVFFSLGVFKYVVYLCKGCDGCCVFCLNCEAWSSMCYCMGSVSVS